MNAIPLCLPDSITPEQFLNEYWQKKTPAYQARVDPTD